MIFKNSVWHVLIVIAQKKARMMTQKKLRRRNLTLSSRCQSLEEAG